MKLLSIEVRLNRRSSTSARFPARRGAGFWKWLGGCALAGWVVLVLLVLLLDWTHNAMNASPATVCRSNLKQLSTGMQMYAHDYDESMPPAAGWQPGIYPYTKSTSILICPARPKATPGYAFNQLLDGRPLKKIDAPARTPMLFESRLGVANASDRMESFLRAHRDHREGNLAFVDGHVKSFETPPPAADGISPGKKKPPPRERNGGSLAPRAR